MNYRETCGTARGALAHQTAGEPLCGWCLEAEAMARARAESVPRRPSPAPSTAPGYLAPVTAAQAAANYALLGAEVEAFERANPHFGRRDGSPLRLVTGDTGTETAA